MSPVDAYIIDLQGSQKKIMMYLHSYLEGLNLEAKIRYKIPFYFGKKSWVCYLNPKESDSVELAMLRGNELSNEQGALQFKGRKQVAGITISKVEDIPFAILQEILQEAILLDETVKYDVRRKK